MMIMMMVMMTMMLPKAMASDDDDDNDYDDEGDDDDYEDEGDGIDHHHGHVHVGKSFPTWTQISDVDMSVSEATFRHGRNFPTWTCPCRKKLSDVDRSLICRRGQMSASDRILSVSEELKFTFIAVLTTAMSTLMPIFCLNFNFISYFIFRYFIFHFYFSIK